MLIVFALMGIAIGAFHWSVSPWLLGGAAIWSIVLAWKIADLGGANYLRRFAATVCVALAVSTGARKLGCLFLGLAVRRAIFSLRVGTI